jgi:hypothetical protein
MTGTENMRHAFLIKITPSMKGGNRKKRNFKKEIKLTV